jgi:hypothetical protein
MNNKSNIIFFLLINRTLMHCLKSKAIYRIERLKAFLTSFFFISLKRNFIFTSYHYLNINKIINKIVFEENAVMTMADF